MAGIFAQCECQQFPGGLWNTGGDSPDSGTSNRYKASEKKGKKKKSLQLAGPGPEGWGAEFFFKKASPP